MNWMIDGVHGDLYRRAMGYPELKPATDEWEIERSIGRKPRSLQNPVPGLSKRLSASISSIIETLRSALRSKETVS
jgi:hypothetical protein